MAVLQAADRAHDRQLHIERQAGRNPVRVDLVRRQAFRFEEDVVAVLAGETMNLVFDRRAVARPNAFDDAGVHRRAIEIGADDVVRPRVGAGDPARQLLRVLAASPRNEKTGSGSSECCSTSTEKSMLLPSSRGGVPVLSRPTGNCSSRSRAASDTDGGSPMRPPTMFDSRRGSGR
jgi:hypothetical protein